MRLSQYFKLGKKQFELDFVDIPLDTDIQLFIDPYAISKREDLFSQESSQIIVNFFQGIIDDIRNKDYPTAKFKLSRLSEPNETHLGLSSNKPMGKGVSGDQSIDVFERLRSSKAVETGFIKDISDCELVIPGIGRDKISDMVTNIIKTKLLDYTEEQCNTYNIPTTSVPSGRVWNPLTSKWEERYTNLPIYKDKKIILVPKIIVRYSLEFSHQKFYNQFVLEYLQEEHINASSGLVTILKNGNHVVYKKDLKADSRYKLSKEFLYNFSEEHPEVLGQYLESLPEVVSPLKNEEIERKQEDPEELNYDDLAEQLKAISAGTESASKYHDLMIGVLTAIFYPNLVIPTKEEKIHEGRKRIDISFQNAAKNGFFEYMTKHIPCPFVMCECKNYSEDPKNPELDQLSGRFSPRRGKLGILVCRTIEDKNLMDKRCKDTSSDDRGYIFVLDDSDILFLLKLKKERNEQAIDQFFMDKYKKLVN